MIVASEMRKNARGTLSGKWGKAVLIALIFIIITGILGTLGNIGEKDETDIYTTNSYLYRNSNENLKIVGLIFTLVNLLVTIPLAFGLVGAYMKLKNGEEVSALEVVTFGFKNFGRAWKVALQAFLKMLAPIIIFIIAMVISIFFIVSDSIVKGLGIALIIAASVYLYSESLKYSLANFIAIEETALSSGEAVKKSKELMTNHRADFFVLNLTFIGWAILATLTLGIGMLWLIPYMQVSQICFYEKAKSEAQESM